MTEQTTNVDIKTFGENFQVPIKPRQKVTIGIDGQICKEFTVGNYATLQVKYWLALQKQ